MCYYDDINSISYIKMGYPKIITYLELKEYVVENLNALTLLLENDHYKIHFCSTRTLKCFMILLISTSC